MLSSGVSGVTWRIWGGGGAKVPKGWVPEAGLIRPLVGSRGKAPVGDAESFQHL